MPVNWYAALVVIVLVGLGSVAVAKYNYNQTAAVVEPTIDTTWHAGLAFDICGTMEPALPASPPSPRPGLTTTGSGVLVDRAEEQPVRPGTTPRWASSPTGTPGLTLTNTTLKYPADLGPAYKNGAEVRRGHA